MIPTAYEFVSDPTYVQFFPLIFMPIKFSITTVGSKVVENKGNVKDNVPTKNETTKVIDRIGFRDERSYADVLKS